MMRRLKPFVDRVRRLPTPVRLSIGILLILGGLLFFLPILGIWMIPLGLLVLSLDFHWARRGYLSLVTWWRKWKNRNGKTGS